MRNVKALKLICWISICLAVWSTTPYIFTENPKSIFNFQAISISDYFISWITRSIIRGYNYLYISFNVILAIGAVFSLISKFKDLALIKFSWLLIANLNLFKVIELLLATQEKGSYYNLITTSLSDIAPLLIFHLLIFILSIFFTRLLFQNQNVIDGIENLEPSTKTQRFLHYLVDTFFAFLLSFSTLYLIGTIIQIRSESSLIIIISLITLIYYLFNEIFIKTTLGKVLTNSIVLNAAHEYPNNKDIIIRNLCRKIPFNTFSFLFDGNWHDKLSNSNVYKIGNKNRSLYVLPFILLIIPIGYGINNVTMSQKKEIKKSQLDKYYNQIEELKSKVKLKSLTKGNSILLHKLGGERGERAVLNISEVEGNIIKGTIKEFTTESKHSRFKYLSEIPFDPFNFESNKVISFKKDSILSSQPQYSSTIRLSYIFNKFIASDSSEYRIIEVLSKNRPRFEKDGSTYRIKRSDDNRNISVFILRARDYNFKVTEIELLSGKGEWVTKLPLEVSSTLSLEFINESKGAKSESLITINSNGETLKFKIYILNTFFDIVQVLDDD